MDFRKFFAKKDQDQDKDQNQQDDKNTVEKVKNWYSDRYESIVIQRNIIILLLILALVALCIGILVINKISTSKNFEPYVIQVEEGSGITQVVNPLNSDILIGNEALARYFIKKYIVARETYNPVDFSTAARQIVRLFSAYEVYRDYLGVIRNDATNPEVIYGSKNTTYAIIRSWSVIEEKNNQAKYLVRFIVRETRGTQKSYYKIAVVQFRYTPMKLSEDEMDVNPVGFQIIGYRVDNDSNN